MEPAATSESFVDSDGFEAAAATVNLSDNTCSSSTLEPVNGLTKRVQLDLFDERELIGFSCFTVGFLVQSLRTKDSEFVQKHGDWPIEKVTFVDISKGKGYVSVVHKATVHFVKNPEVYTTILKVPGKTAPLELEFPDLELIKLHRSECDFYDNLAPFLGVPVPRVFATFPLIPGVRDGVIHMEDVSRTGQTGRAFDFLNASQILDVTRHLARMHKNTLTRTDWHGKFLENQLTYVELIGVVEKSAEPFLEMCAGRETLKAMASKYFKLRSNLDFVKYVYVQSWKDLGIGPVLVHGDLWGGNIMWLQDEFGEPSNTVGAILDWQYLYEGSIMSDLARFMVYCTDADVRQRLERSIFEFYHQELSRLFELEGLSCPVSLEQVQKAYQLMFFVLAVDMPMMMNFGLQIISDDEEKDLVEARKDRMLTSCLHFYQDIDRLAQNELKWIFEKFQF